jgi:hypothetical protein
MTASATTSRTRDTFRCGCPRRLSLLVPPDVTAELVRLYTAGAAVRQLAELSGLSENTTIAVLRDNNVPLRRVNGSRAPTVITTFTFPPHGGLPTNAHDKHRPHCPARPENILRAREHGASIADIAAAAGMQAGSVGAILRYGTATPPRRA